MRPFCLSCGVKESIAFSGNLQQSYNRLDDYLSYLGKRRTLIKPDGHCLPRAVFSGMKRKGQLADLITYKQLFKTAVKEIKSNTDERYNSWLVDSKESTLEQLKLYENEIKYSSNVVDLFLVALSDVCKATIIAYYTADDDTIKHHIFHPTHGDSSTLIEVSFVGGHYDLVVDKLQPYITASEIALDDCNDVIAINGSPCKKTSQHAIKSEIKTEQRNSCSFDVNFDLVQEDVIDLVHLDVAENSNSEIEDEETLSLCSSIESDDAIGNIEPVTYCGKRKYIRPDVFDNVEPVEADAVPGNIDGIVVYIVPLKRDGNLANCKGLRPWGHAQSSTSKSFRDGPRLLHNCRGSYRCTNLRCKNLCDFGVNRKEFTVKDEYTVCYICGVEAVFIPCDARIILEENLQKNIVTCKHHGTHTCPVEIRGRTSKEEIGEDNLNKTAIAVMIG